MTGPWPGRAEPPPPGAPFRIGAYDVIGFLGKGGMGVVYLGRGRGGELVAIKVVRAELAREPEFRARFRREAESAMRVPRFCTAEVVAADPDAAEPYLVTEFIDGPTLKEVVRSGGPLRRAELDQLGVSMAAALTGIHAAGVVHRDLKPANVLLSRLGPRVIDFGIAAAVDAVRLTVEGQAMGTPAYMAPEQMRGNAGPASDVFAWGGVMLFAATGRYPFGTGPLPELAARVMYAEPDLDGLAEPIRGIVAAAFAKDETHRPTPGRLLQLMGVTGTDPAAVQTRLAGLGLPDPAMPPPGDATRARGGDGLTVRFGPGVEARAEPDEATRIWREGTGDRPKKGRPGRSGRSAGTPGGAVPGRGRSGPGRSGSGPSGSGRSGSGRSGSGRSGRARARSVVAGLLGFAIFAAVAVWLILQNLPGDLRATGLTVKAAKQEQTCGDVDLIGDVTTNGEPGRLTYQWKLNDRRRPEAAREITVSKGTRSVRLPFLWQFSGSGRPAQYTATLIITGANQGELRDSATFTYSCPR